MKLSRNGSNITITFGKDIESKELPKTIKLDDTEYVDYDDIPRRSVFLGSILAGFVLGIVIIGLVVF